MDPPVETFPVRVLLANVGNVSISSMKYNNKLCEKDTENRIRDNILRLNPDIVLLQEVIDPEQCEGVVENNPDFVCYQFEIGKTPDQSARLLGDQYLIARERRPGVGVEIIALKKDVGHMPGHSGEPVCDGATVSYPIGPGCNNDFTVSMVEVVINDIPFSIVNAHTQSNNPECRLYQLRQIFEGADGNPPLLGENKNAILGGDFNLDPFRDKEDPSVKYWNRFVGSYGDGKPYYYHSGPVEHDPPFFTIRLFYRRRTVDHLVSNFAFGVCKTLGEAPGTSRLDGGKGTDHRALICDLQIPMTGSHS